MRLSILYPGCRYDPTKSLVWRDTLSGMAFLEVGEVGWSGIVFLGGCSSGMDVVGYTKVGGLLDVFLC